MNEKLVNLGQFLATRDPNCPQTKELLEQNKQLAVDLERGMSEEDFAVRYNEIRSRIVRLVA